MNEFESGAIATSLSASKAATNQLDDSLHRLIQQLRNGNGIDRPAALSLLEKARADVQRRLGEIGLKAKTK